MRRMLSAVCKCAGGCVSQPTSVAIKGSYAYVTGFYSYSLAVVDISSPTAPSIVGSVPSSAHIGRVRPQALSPMQPHMDEGGLYTHV